jgi:hypothetical protein
MPEYLLELYVPATDPDLAAQNGRSVRAAAEELTLRGTLVRYHRSIFVSHEETCFVLLEAETIDAIRETARLARVSSDHVSAAVSHPTASDRQPHNAVRQRPPAQPDGDSGIHDHTVRPPSRKP